MNNTDLLLDDLLGKVPPKTVNLDISKLHPFDGHPYKVLDDEDMEALVESIRTQGVLTPLVVDKWKRMPTRLSPDTDDCTHAKRQELVQFLP